MTQFLAADLIALRQRLAKMSDNELREWGRFTDKKCRPETRRSEPLSLRNADGRDTNGMAPTTPRQDQALAFLAPIEYR